jgi:hypothetical protein
MSEVQEPRRWGRSVGAVLFGFVVVAVLSLGTDSALRAAGIFPALLQPMTDRLFALATGYRIVYAILGSYITAAFAPDRPMGHALAGGVVGLLLSIAGAVATWSHTPAMGPHWYPLALVVTAMPCAWIGGKWRSMQLLGMPRR